MQSGRRRQPSGFAPSSRKSLKEQPMTTLAVAAAIGLVLGALWKK
jgi:ElaB/YqjD/DUF883 family membrane-anchored ribosome-binding protein